MRTISNSSVHPHPSPLAGHSATGRGLREIEFPDGNQALGFQFENCP